MIKSPIASPYGVQESLNWIKKSLTGLNRENAGLVDFIPRTHVLNEIVKPRNTLAFVGNIMPTGEKFISVGDPLREFLRGCDYLIGNFEGVMTTPDKGSWMPSSDRRHDKQIMDILANIFPPAKTYLSVANNHSGDYGGEEFLESVQLLTMRQFKVFGSKDRPFCDINDALRIVSGTMWSNRKNDFVFWMKDAMKYVKPAAFNILYPHFGYEFELYPRPVIVDLVGKYLEDFDAVIGHHSHCPQPITAIPVRGVQRLAAYSLGNFLDIRKSDRYRYGMAVKMKFGLDHKGEWKTGEVQWRLTKCTPLPDGESFVDISRDELFKS